MRNNEIKVIDYLDRLPNSRNGNPRYRVVFTDGTTAITQSNSMIAFTIDNLEYRHTPVVVHATPSGRIYNLTRLS